MVSLVLNQFSQVWGPPSVSQDRSVEVAVGYATRWKVRGVTFNQMWDTFFSTKNGFRTGGSGGF